MAAVVSANDVRKLLLESELAYQMTRSMFYFAECLSFLRPLLNLLNPLPLAAEYVIIAARPQ